MPEYRTPGVYVEIKKGTPPIQPVGTSTAGFVGVVKNVGTGADDPRMPDSPDPATPYVQAAVSEPVPMTSFDQFLTVFGLVQKSTVANTNSTLAHAVFGFFQNGGARCYVARVTAWLTGAAQNQEVTTALKKYQAVDDVSIMAVPGAPVIIQNALIDHCIAMKYRFAVLDGQTGVGTPDLQSVTGSGANTSKFAAMYYPFIQVSNLTAERDDDGVILQPPSGHVAGVIARTDIQQGVHYSPANTLVRGALGLEKLVNDAEQGSLNVVNAGSGPVNVVRNFKGNITVWGARTRAAVGSSEAVFNYVAVQRTMSMIAQSIDEGTRFAVFKPNNQRLWEQIKRAVRGFLTTVWRDGALFGDTPEQAFYVKCDEGTNPPESRLLGRVIIEVGVAIVQPAEFVIFRISQQAQITP